MIHIGPQVTPEERVDRMLTEVLGLRTALREADGRIARLRAELDAEREAVVRLLATSAEQAGQLADRDAELAQLRAHRDLPLSRLVVGVAACAVTAVVGLVDGARCRCGHERAAHRHYRAGRDCSRCPCPRWGWRRRRG